MSLVWQIEFTKEAKASMQKLDKPIREHIDKFLTRIAKLDDPRSIGGALKGILSGRWRYRVGDYRIICEFQNDKLIILVLEIGHRSKVYK